MILAIDIGNTNVVLGGIEGNDILFEARMATDSIKTSDQYCAELKNILALFDVVPARSSHPSCRRCSIRSAPLSAS